MPIIHAECNALVGAAKDIGGSWYLIEMIKGAPRDKTNDRMVFFDTDAVFSEPPALDVAFRDALGWKPKLYTELTAQLVARALEGKNDSNFGT